MRREVDVWRDGDLWLLASRSPTGEPADGWRHQLTGRCPEAAVLGAAVRAGLAQADRAAPGPGASAQPPPTRSPQAPAPSATPELTAPLVRVALSGQRLRVAPMRYAGPGLGYGAVAAAASTLARSGLDGDVEGGLQVPPQATAVIDGTLGTMVLQAMATASAESP